jgi:hypothetical protein
MDGGERALHVSLAPFIQRIIQPFEELHLSVTYLTPRDVIKCLELFPDLKRLSLQGFRSLFDSPYIFFPGADWTAVNRSSICEEILERFMRKIGPRAKFLDESASSSAEFQEYQVNEDCGDEDEYNASDLNYPCLCPKLDVLHVDGASVSDTMMLRFIHFRVSSYRRHGVLRLRWLKITFPLGRVANPDTIKEVEELTARTDANINVEYGGPFTWGDHRKYSPYWGLASVDLDGVPSHVYNPCFSPMLASEH